MYTLKIGWMFVLLMTSIIYHIDHPVQDKIKAIYEKSYFMELEMGSLDKQQDDNESILASIKRDLFKNGILTLILQQSKTFFRFHLVTVFYQGSYI